MRDQLPDIVTLAASFNIPPASVDAAAAALARSIAAARAAPGAERQAFEARGLDPAHLAALPLQEAFVAVAGTFGAPLTWSTVVEAAAPIFAGTAMGIVEFLLWDPASLACTVKIVQQARQRGGGDPVSPTH